jgi:S1-C subfamily serine protease
MTPSLARALGSKVQHGALIVGVNSSSPASRAGLRAGTREVNVLGIRGIVAGGDVIVGVDGHVVRRADDIVRIVSFQLEPKSVAVFTVVRGGRRLSVPVTLGERELPSG